MVTQLRVTAVPTTVFWKARRLRTRVPSFCGDASVGTGELDVCESTGGDGNVDDLQLSLISDNAALEVDVTTHEANASIEVTEPTSGLTTTALYTLSCTAATDLDCPDETLYGVGIANCCMPRPDGHAVPRRRCNGCV